MLQFLFVEMIIVFWAMTYYTMFITWVHETLKRPFDYDWYIQQIQQTHLSNEDFCLQKNLDFKIACDKDNFLDSQIYKAYYNQRDNKVFFKDEVTNEVRSYNLGIHSNHRWN